MIFAATQFSLRNVGCIRSLSADNAALFELPFLAARHPNPDDLGTHEGMDLRDLIKSLLKEMKSASTGVRQGVTLNTAQVILLRKKANQTHWTFQEFEAIIIVLLGIVTGLRGSNLGSIQLGHIHRMSPASDDIRNA
jgi:hypothetical protein